MSWLHGIKRSKSVAMVTKYLCQLSWLHIHVAMVKIISVSWPVVNVMVTWYQKIYVGCHGYVSCHGYISMLPWLQVIYARCHGYLSTVYWSHVFPSDRQTEIRLSNTTLATPYLSSYCWFYEWWYVVAAAVFPDARGARRVFGTGVCPFARVVQITLAMKLLLCFSWQKCKLVRYNFLES